MKKISATTREKNKKKRLAKETSYTKLYSDDLKEVMKLCSAEGSTPAATLRDIVSDWLRSQRVKSLGRDESDTPIRKMYERIMTEQLAPLAEGINQIKKMLSGTPEGRSLSAPQTSLIASEFSEVEILKAIAGLRALIDQTGSDISESAAIQVNQLDQVRKSQLAVQAITSETFASSWTIADVIARYLVEINLRNQNLPPDEVEAEVVKERIALRLEGLMKISAVEKLFNLPEEQRLAELVLPRHLSPIDRQNSLY